MNPTSRSHLESANMASSSFVRSLLRRGIYPLAVVDIVLYVREKKPPLLLLAAAFVAAGRESFVDPRAHRN